MEYYGASSRTTRRRIKTKVQEHLMSLAVDALEVLDETVEQRMDDDQDFDNDTLDQLDLTLDSDETNDSFQDTDEEEIEPQLDMKTKLAEWAANRNISQSTLSELLQILIVEGLNLPKDPRTLMSTLKDCEVKKMGSGSYYHFGLCNAICAELTNAQDELTDTLTLRLNVDGIPLFRSSNAQLWPILGKIKELPGSNVFMISLYAGPSKPPSVHEFMKDVVEEFKKLTKEGLHFNEKHYCVPLPDAFICDAPARAFLKCIKGHSGYSSCERCVQSGVYLNGKIVHPDMEAALRTDAQFYEMIDEEHHRDVSPLRELGVGLVISFVLDYMHLVCLGIVRKLVSLWVKGPLTCRI